MRKPNYCNLLCCCLFLFYFYDSSLTFGSHHRFRYFDQLSALESKIPIHEFQVPFKYKDAFDKGSIFGGRASLSKFDLDLTNLAQTMPKP